MIVALPICLCIPLPPHFLLSALILRRSWCPSGRGQNGISEIGTVEEYAIGSDKSIPFSTPHAQSCTVGLPPPPPASPNPTPVDCALPHQAKPSQTSGFHDPNGTTCFFRGTHDCLRRLHVMSCFTLTVPVHSKCWIVSAPVHPRLAAVPGRTHTSVTAGARNAYPR